MDARLLGAGAAALLVTVGGITFLQFQDGADAETNPRIRLYQGGYAWVERTLQADVPGTLPIDVPEGTILATVRVTGDNVTADHLRGPGGALAQPAPGERVRVITTMGGEFEGTLLNAEQYPYLTLATEEGTVHVNPQEVVAVVEAGTGEAPEGGATVTAELSGAEGSREVRVGYLVRGPGWDAAYHIDPDTGETVLYALVTNTPTLEGATVDFAVGAPQVPGGPRPFAAMEAAAAAGDRAAERVVPSVEGELHLFTLNRTIDLTPGGTQRVAAWEGDLAIAKREYVVDTQAGVTGKGENYPVAAEERVTFHNTLGIPLPPGTAHFYREGNWTGAADVSYTPVDGNVTLTVGPARDVRAEREISEAEARGEVTNVTERIRVKNFKDETAEVRVILRLPTERLNVVRVTPEPEVRTGERVEWSLTVPPDATEDVALTYERYEPRPTLPEPVVR